MYASRIVGKFLVPVKLKHDSLNELQHLNYVSGALDGFIFSDPPQLGKKSLSALPVKGCKHSF